MKIKEVFTFSILLALASDPWCAYGELPKGATNHYKPNRRIFTYHHGGDETLRTLIMGESCNGLLQFGGQFLDWSKRISSNATATPVAPRCECEMNDYGVAVCGIELTDLFPECFKTKMRLSGRCCGPNCFNAALIAAGCLDANQFRHTTAEEFNFFTSKYYRKVEIGDINQLEMNDLLVMYPKTETDNPRPIHAGIYIGHHIAFDKAGLLSDQNYRLVELGSDLSYPTHVPSSVKVFRRNGTPYETIRNAQTRSLEEDFSQLFGSTELEVNEVDFLFQLEKLQEKFIDIMMDSNSSSDTPPSSPNSHALEGLNRSFHQAPYTTRQRIVTIELENGSATEIRANQVKSFKRPDLDRCSVPNDLRVGDSIQILEDAWTIQVGLKKDSFYKVLKYSK